VTRRPGPGAVPPARTVAESGAGVLLIEPFATVALGLAHHAHIMEGGRLRYSGLASNLRENPGPAQLRLSSPRQHDRGAGDRRPGSGRLRLN